MIGGRRHVWGATTIKPIGTCNCPRRAGDGQLSVDKGVPSPGGQVSEMAGRGARVAVGLVLFGISSTSTRATTRHPGRTLGRIGGGHDWVRPGWRAVRASPGRGDAEKAPRGCGSTRERNPSTVDYRAADECLTE